MKYCGNCGQPLREGVKVCTNCGTPVRNDGPNYKHSENVILINNHVPIRVIKTWLIVTIVLAIIIALVVIFTIAKNQMSPENKRLIAHAIKKTMLNHYLSN